MTDPQILERIRLLMAREDLPHAVIDLFASYYRELCEDRTGYVYEHDIEPVADSDVVRYDDLRQCEKAGRKAINQAALIKLNGGLGTTMGLERAKALLPVKDGLTFLDIIIRQVHAFSQALGTRLPLVLMNSFHTNDDTLRALAPYATPGSELPFTYVQHKYPKILKDSLWPAEVPGDPGIAWNPPGHGDVYMSLFYSGMLDLLMDRGARYAFISNIDNLGAIPDMAILGYMTEKQVPFIMEVSQRTDIDRKGGHLARWKNGAMILRESAQCAPDEAASFQDITRYCFFNTNNLWIDLEALARVLRERGNIIALPLIRNAKTLDPRDTASPPVYQLESAVGAAISLFPGAQAVVVPLDRFVPIKGCGNLLSIRSDCYALAEDYRIANHSADTRPCIDLDPLYYGGIDDFEARFAAGIPSLRQCRSLSIRGDVAFGANAICRGDVRITNASGKQVKVRDHAVLEGEIAF